MYKLGGKDFASLDQVRSYVLNEEMGLTNKNQIVVKQKHDVLLDALLTFHYKLKNYHNKAKVKEIKYVSINNVLVGNAPNTVRVMAVWLADEERWYPFHIDEILRDKEIPFKKKIRASLMKYWRKLKKDIIDDLSVGNKVPVCCACGTKNDITVDHINPYHRYINRVCTDLAEAQSAEWKRKFNILFMADGGNCFQYMVETLPEVFHTYKQMTLRGEFQLLCEPCHVKEEQRREEGHVFDFTPSYIQNLDGTKRKEGTFGRRIKKLYQVYRIVRDGYDD